MSCHNSFAIYAISRGFVHAIKSATEFLMYKHGGSIHRHTVRTRKDRQMS